MKTIVLDNSLSKQQVRWAVETARNTGWNAWAEPNNDGTYVIIADLGVQEASARAESASKCT
jgi:hypothetical protein